MTSPRVDTQRVRRRTITRQGAGARWWIYQRERFPLATHAPLIAAFSFCTVSFSEMARGVVRLPSPRTAIVAFGVAFLFFLQLRISDEFKDFEEDARYRPYRPVPRGLITLRELGIVAVVGGILQLALALWLSPALLPFLLLVWAYLGLMSKEFFAHTWLKAHPFTYMWTHMLILPLIDLFGTACDWKVAGAPAPPPLAFLLAVSFCNGFVVEIGRKIRAPEDEETGVETYSVLWGRGRAVAVWLVSVTVTALLALVAAGKIAFVLPLGGALAIVLLAAVALAASFLRRPSSRSSKGIELLSGLWTLLMYLGLGAVPLLWRVAA